MTFEEEFPSLTEPTISKDSIMVSKQVIQQCCLDKQRVKELLQSVKKDHKEMMEAEIAIIGNSYDLHIQRLQVYDYLLKELGLEDDNE